MTNLKFTSNTKTPARSEKDSSGDTRPVRREQALVPPVDIRENNEMVLLVADMPGVSPETLKVEWAHERLTIEGTISADLPENMISVDADLRGSHYQRQFKLGQEIDSEKIKAELKNGVLTLALPKRGDHRVRQIPVSA
ncbi:MAG: Hsp20/alpha crystallin family protein [Gammaproteobacteria bacterium]